MPRAGDVKIVVAGSSDVATRRVLVLYSAALRAILECLSIARAGFEACPPLGVDEMKPEKNPVKVLYVAGSSRSGSTFLDIILGDHPDIQGVGELVYLPRDGWIGNERCSCGEHAKDCPFWSAVRRVWAERVGVDDVEGYLALQESFRRYRHLPQLLREYRRPSPRFRAYADQTQKLFEAIREVGGKPVIVDSSKRPLRGFALSMMPGIDLRFLHLTRDGRGVAASLNKSWLKDEKAGVTRDIEARSVWSTAAVWLLVNLTSSWVMRQLDPERATQVRYESLTMDPKDVLSKVGRLLDLNLTQVADRVASGDAIEVGHVIAGNRLRMSKSVQLRPDAGQWKNKLSPREQHLAWTLMGWLLRRYGYKK